MVRCIGWMVCLYTAYVDARDHLDIVEGEVVWSDNEDTIRVTQGTIAGQRVILALTEKKLFARTAGRVARNITKDHVGVYFIGGVDFVSSFLDQNGQQKYNWPLPKIGDCVLRPGSCRPLIFDGMRTNIRTLDRRSARHLLNAADTFIAQYPEGVPVTIDGHNYHSLSVNPLYNIYERDLDRQDRICCAEEDNCTVPCMIACGIGGNYENDGNFDPWVPFASKASAAVIRGIIQNLQ
ncbi:hypothetical protein ACHAQJ_008714 [Trichoderma viride]